MMNVTGTFFPTCSTAFRLLICVIIKNGKTRSNTDVSFPISDLNFMFTNLCLCFLLKIKTHLLVENIVRVTKKY